MTILGKQSLLISILLSLVFVSKTQSQTLIVDDTANLKVGVYRTFKEFRYNSPSITTEFTVRPEEKRFDYAPSEFKDSSRHTIYYLLLPESYTITDTIWGFCDGKNIYINTWWSTYSPKGTYERLEYIGRYCLFFKWQPGGYKKPPRICRVAININNGLAFDPDILSHSDLKQILEKDTYLYNKYKQVKERKAKSFYYLKLYSEKHKDQIKP